MKIHHLSLSAFGPFAQTQDIDFDAVGAAGLFLIHGRTGAGKSSLLDAMCFALFGSIPRQRVSTAAVKVASDHAPGQQPTVSMEFSVAGRRLRITRTASYDVVGRKGQTTTRRSTVLLEELRAGHWQEQAVKEQETGEFIKRTLGLDLQQFVQLILLPQGEFAAFLRAKPDDRGVLLERLFAIDRFRGVETWLTERRSVARTRRDETAVAVARCRDRIDEVLVASGCEEPLPDTDLSSALSLPSALSFPSALSLPSALAALLEQLEQSATEAMAHAQTAADAAVTARQAFVDAQQRAVRRAEAQAAETEREALLAAAPSQISRRARVAAARRAQQIDPFAAAHRLRSGRRDTSRAAFEAAVASLPPALRGDSDTWWPRLTIALTDGGQPLVGLPQLAASLQRATERREQLRGDETAAAARVSSLQARQTETLTAQTALRDVTAESEAVTAQWNSITATMGVLSKLSAVATAVASERASCESAVRAAAVAQAASAGARTDLDRLRADRLAGIAAELGAELETGVPCPVCGSAQHPCPAAATADAVTADDVSAAAAVADRAAADAATADQALAAARARLSTLEAQWATAHDDLPEWGAVSLWLPAKVVSAAGSLWSAASPLAPHLIDELTSTVGTAQHAAADEVERVRQAADQLADLAQTADLLTAELSAATAEVVTVRARIADTDTEIAEVSHAIDTGRRQHADACPCGSDADGHAVVMTAVDDVVRLLDAAAADKVLADEAAADLAAALATQHFVSVDEYDESRCSTEELAALEAGIADYDARLQATTAVLELPAVVAACAAPPDDLDALQTAAASAEDRANNDRAAATGLETTVTRLRTLSADLGTVHSAYVAAERDFATVAALADTVNGAGEDNELRMRLSAYVLAARLESVTTFANERLSAMSDGRFTLEHSDARAKHGARSGLGLVVRDAWTGQTRDTATLSGGESFMASLSLALGLGDAVLAETGGRPLETLLVDEGFGSLDQDTLDRVLQVLDELRAGDRVVGIVSHVPDLRQRIPTQLEVQRSEAGSSVRMRDGASAA
ncbi:SMC family ATPase [Branchiibius sp. NY16-3462-2]|uniref:AAA family ATPase n=1 Tax=Branchiibius sp. NY16-3462-2 TaxID=1807500 RepID=UPI0007980193|nr:SMC family ATPase [Branchiibius sp. NY16-3462-2]KYH44543.1 hypothetical protein AZH51_08555 [Branchiibius sp. NY16-3462-2]